jgi:site-specific recombinase XerD
MELSLRNPPTLPQCKGPLAIYLSAFATLLDEQGYARKSAGLQIRLVADFSYWLLQKKIRAQNLTVCHIQRYLRYRARHRRPKRGDTAALNRLLSLLHRMGILVRKDPCSKVTPVIQIINEYADYLRRERMLASATLALYLPFIRVFLIKRFGNGPVQLSMLCAADVVRFVQRQAAVLIPKRAKVMTTSLRSFLRYALCRGYIRLDLSACVPTVPNWSMTTIPRAIAAEHIQAILAHCKRHTAVGCRDFAILLLLARLGLRSGEIAALTLDDIDWQAGCISVTGKGGRPTQLPLPIDVGEAIAVYLKEGRPNTCSRALFMRSRAPIRSFKSQCAVGSIVKHALARAEIDTLNKGAHQFRHALATEMLRQGASLVEIGELLRHRHPQTTAIYAKVDLPALRTLSLPWPGRTS